LSQSQKQRLTDKKLAAGRRGGEARRNQRLSIIKEINNRTLKDIGSLSKRELFLIGVCLYWAEGAKQKETNVSQITRLSNSDPKLINVFLKWLREICKINKDDIFFYIFLHETAKEKLQSVKEYWSEVTEFPLNKFNRVTWKKNKIKTNRKNIGDSYRGLLSVNVKRSTNLNRKIAGWILGIYKSCGVVQW
jgi:hypothetical protein